MSSPQSRAIVKVLFSIQSFLIMATSTEDKKAYKAKVKAQIDKLDAQLDELKAKAQQAKADATIQYHEKIEELQAKRDDANEKFKKLQEAGEEAWEDIRTGFEKAWSDVENAFKQASEKFNS